MSKKRPSRFTIDLLGDQTETLNGLREKTGMSLASIFRRGLLLFSWAESQKDLGRKVVAIDQSGAVHTQEVKP